MKKSMKQKKGDFRRIERGGCEALTELNNCPNEWTSVD